MTMADCRSVPFFYVFWLLTASALLGGCGAGYTAIRGEDDNVFFPSLRVSYPLVMPSSRFGPGEAAVEADFARGRGTSHQALGAGETISFGGTMYAGPVDVRQNFKLDVASAAVRVGIPRNSPVYADLLLGVLYTGLDLNLQSGSQTAYKEFRDGGGIAGIGIGSRLTDRLMLDLRFVFEIIPFNWTRARNMQIVDFQASYWLTQHVAVTGGYRRWKYQIDADGSDVNALIWQGFSGGLAFSF
jgi:hypothetical protein